ncbi:family 43 glycosylhydrolase [Bacteroides intestinalis]|uniref:family 43 glycosylhydrolase n=1 Tax=Bacteroides intestinalis TaxID=329854 RepID=UPI0012315DB5|nr:family 43 glycosylhydrolase [Bacteroides intestinalis]KAA4711169.1 family 43 glycosylhydrolase [Bacteroides intestinalis]
MKNKLSLLLVSFFLFSCAENKQVTEQQTTFCNPMNLDYGWGCFQKREKKARTAADPVIVLFKDKYYLFTTMDIGGYRVSDDLITWKDVYFNPEIHASALDIDHYVAPAVAADDNYVYFINFTRDRSKKKVDVIRSADPENGKWEKCGEVRRMADPCLFIDDGRFYFYYGLGAEQSTTFFEVNPETFEEIEGTKKVLREYITDVKECTSGYHFGRRELYDEIDASAWMGKFEKIPCPEGAWIVKNNDKYYLQYATPGTICNWYCDIVMESDSANGGFVEQPYNPVSLKVGGFIGGAGHSCVFKDKYGNWWQATSMWIGNHDEFERRIGLFPVSFDAKGRMRTHTVLGDYPMLLPQKKFEPQDISAFGWMLQSFNKACMASSSLSGFEPEKAADENVRTWWSAESGNAGEHFVMNFGKKVQINSVHYHAYKLYTSNDGHTWKLLADKSGNKTAVPHEYLELSKPVEASYMKVENVHTPKEGKFALLDLRVFGSGYSDKPGQVKELSVKRNQKDGRYASIAWNKASGADGYLVRFGYQPDFLNQCIQVKGNETTELLLHILTKGVKYYYRVDTYNDSGITEGNVISE